MGDVLTGLDGRTLLARYRAVRDLTEMLAEPLSAEDQTVQSMPDVSPTKWHRAHTSWFFETFLLVPLVPGYRPYHPDFGYLFNSYYEGVGAQYPRSDRGLLSRPGVGEVAAYRSYVDEAMAGLLDGGIGPRTADLVTLGLNHEEQHQELLLMDIKHVLAQNPLLPAYSPTAGERVGSADRAGPPGAGWTSYPGGVHEIGHTGDGFAYDNESPRHRVLLEPFALADRPVTCGEWTEFVDDGGYHRADLWLSDGWAALRAQGIDAPLYWSDRDGDRSVFTLGGSRAVDPAEPVVHVSYYEADAFARWADARLPTEAEWEVAAGPARAEGNLLDRDRLHPRPVAGPSSSPFGDVWQWTSSAYSPYPGFRPAPGAVGEYNGKFMVGQYVLRGGSCATPPGHVRSSYRNFFPPGARWAFSGLRLARDA